MLCLKVLCISLVAGCDAFGCDHLQGTFALSKGQAKCEDCAKGEVTFSICLTAWNANFPPNVCDSSLKACVFSFLLTVLQRHGSRGLQEVSSGLPSSSRSALLLHVD